MHAARKGGAASVWAVVHVMPPAGDAANKAKDCQFESLHKIYFYDGWRWKIELNQPDSPPTVRPRPLSREYCQKGRKHTQQALPMKQRRWRLPKLLNLPSNPFDKCLLYGRPLSQGMKRERSGLRHCPLENAEDRWESLCAQGQEVTLQGPSQLNRKRPDCRSAPPMPATGLLSIGAARLPTTGAANPQMPGATAEDPGAHTSTKEEVTTQETHLQEADDQSGPVDADITHLAEQRAMQMVPPVSLYANLPQEWPLARLSVQLRHIGVLLRVTLYRRVAELNFRGVDFRHLQQEVMRSICYDFNRIGRKLARRLASLFAFLNQPRALTYMQTA